MMFLSSIHGLVTMEEMLRHIDRFSKEAPDAPVVLWVGTDSQEYPYGVKFVTTVTAYRRQRGGQIYKAVEILKRPVSLMEKLDHETHLTIQTIGELRAAMQDSLYFHQLEFHIDVGQKGSSKKYLQRVVGYAESLAPLYDYRVRVKPDSIGASCIANRFTKSRAPG